jgi:hypothetical protein
VRSVFIVAAFVSATVHADSSNVLECVRGQRVSITASGLSIAIRGECETVTVSGSANVVTLECNRPAKGLAYPGVTNNSSAST